MSKIIEVFRDRVMSSAMITEEKIELCYGGGGDGNVRKVASDVTHYEYSMDHFVYVYERTEHILPNGNRCFKFVHKRLKM